jgi:hypothetical protein
MNRRQLLQSAGLIGLSTLLPSMAFAAEVDTSDLKKMTGDIVPIGREERAGRICRRQEGVRQKGRYAGVLDPRA